MMARARGWVEEYMSRIGEMVTLAASSESTAIEEGGRLIGSRVQSGGVVHVFGAGHSQLVAADSTFRAGGPAWANGVLDPALSLGRGAWAATLTERIGEAAGPIFQQTRPSAKDATVVVCNSGVTPITVHWAELSKAAGLAVIALISQESLTRFVDSGRTSVTEYSDVVLDNHCPLGDAAVVVGDPMDAVTIGPTSTILNTFLMHSLFVKAHEYLVAVGKEVEAFQSGHLPDAMDVNERHMKAYGNRIRVF